MNIIIDDCKICINKILFNNSLLKLAIDSNNSIIKYSNDFLYLINFNDNTFDNKIKILYNKIINSIGIYIDKEVIDFTTIFSSGTSHGYAGLFNIIHNYLLYYNNEYIIIYENSQKGILDIIYHIMNKINKLDKIIIIESDLVYKFKKITFIHNQYHDFNKEYSKLIDYIITDYIIDIKYNIKFEKICIIKSTISSNITSIGIVSQDLINKYCNRNNLISIEPTNYNEIEFINILYNCKEFVVSWGTSFFKNFHYISDKCILIKVIVYTDCFINQYNNHKLNNSIISNYKKANIEYIIIDNISKYLDKN
jgi:hypothetical protein